MRKIAILDPYLESPETNAIERIRARNNDRAIFEIYAPAQNQLPKQDNHYDAFLSLGSYASALDSAPWLKNHALFIHSQLILNKPVFAICFSHQLMARFYGGTVDYINTDQSHLKGVRKIQFQDKNLDLIYTHQQRVTAISQELVNLGGSIFPFEILKHKDLPLLSFQAHPEADISFCLREQLDLNLKNLELIQKEADTLIDHFLGLK